MFTFFTATLFFVCFDVISLYLKIPSMFFSYGPILPGGTAVFIGIINFYLFVYKGKHVQLFSRYLEVQSTKKDVLCFFLSVGSIFLFFYAMLAK
jgi:hypothetical protein